MWKQDQKKQQEIDFLAGSVIMDRGLGQEQRFEFKNILMGLLLTNMQLFSSQDVIQYSISNITNIYLLHNFK